MSPKITRGGGASNAGDLTYTYDVDRAAARLRAAAPATAAPEMATGGIITSPGHRIGEEGCIIGEHGPEVRDLPPGATVVLASGITDVDLANAAIAAFERHQQETDEGGEQPSPGNSSSTSSTKTRSSSENTATPPRKHARTAGNRSNKGKATSSTARQGTTNTRATTSDSDE